mmetsp:Transcript_15977/g.37846  ORF Transcript_15977/g.37846 Transcript_15977/m.37846 type:complete len:519 (-) Transcript_15977:19-1575(-)
MSLGCSSTCASTTWQCESRPRRPHAPKPGRSHMDPRVPGMCALLSVPMARCCCASRGTSRGLRRGPARRALEDEGASNGSILGMLTSDDVDSWSDEDEEEWEESFAVDLQQGIEESRDRHQRALDLGLIAGHQPVLLVPTMQWLFPSHCLANADDHLSVRSGNQLYNGLYVDCTFGRGGYSREILSRLSKDARLVAMDIDPTSIQKGRLLEEEDPRFRCMAKSFADLDKIFNADGSAEMAELIEEVGRPKGIVFDIGVSSVQVDDKSRGFNLSNLSRVSDTQLDLRMNPTIGPTAAEWLEAASVEEIAWVLREFGDDHQETLQAERMAQVIYDDQQRNGPYRSMQRFCELVGQAKLVGDEEFEHTVRGRLHPARLTVQALRIFINSECRQLKEGLEAAFRVLDMGGRCVIATFKRMEESVVRQFMLQFEDPDETTVARIKPKRRLVELYPLCGTDLDYAVRQISVAMKPAMGEVAMNTRARSGKLHVLEKVPRTCPRLRVKPRRPQNRFREPDPNPVI